MKKMKKLISIVMVLAMVMPMVLATSLTAAADGEVTITVTNMPEGASVSYAQLIRPNMETATGWEFVSDEIAKAYINAFGGNVNAQQVIWALIKYQAGSAEVDGMPEDTITITASQIDTALKELEDSLQYSSENVTNHVISGITTAGVYSVKLTLQNYSATPMSAYVAFGAVENEVYPTLQPATVNAKVSKMGLEKTDDDADKAVAIGDTVTFTVKVNVPRIPANENNKYFYITDILKGAEFVDADVNTAKITVGGEEYTNFTVTKETYTENEGTENEVRYPAFRIDLSDLVATHAGAEVVLTYDAKVTAAMVDNHAYAGNDPDSLTNNTYGDDEDKLYSGTITFTKTDEGTTPLAGAEFTVFTVVNGEKKYLSADTVGYKLVDETSAQKFVTDGNGKITLTGLDVGTYTFHETKAPTGYSINETDVDVTLVLDTTNADYVITKEADLENNIEEEGYYVATAEYTGTGTMKDTKLSALPETGGMGTYIFTILGVAIMAAMAFSFIKGRKTQE